jgi:hypothetical protein
MNANDTSLELARIQQWMQAVITHPAGVPAGLQSSEAYRALDVSPEQVESVIDRSQAQTSIERLSVYANAYFARLLEVLAAEFPALVFALGENLFQEFALGYLREHPSRSCTLADLGSSFPEYLAKTRPPRETGGPDWADFLIDLATLERTYSEVFDGAGAEGQQLLQSDELRSLDAKQFLKLRFVPVPCLRLLSLRFPVHEYASAVRKQEHPDLPAPAPTWLAVTRRDYVVRRAAVSSPEFAALGVLVDGGDVAASLEAAQAHWIGDVESLIPAVRGWFYNWSAARYFQGIVTL